jgi:hypothetical protein
VADFGRTLTAASGGLGRLAQAIGGGGGAGGSYERARQDEMLLQSRLAQALSTIDANRAKAAQDEQETRTMSGRGDVGDELMAAEAGTTLPVLKAWRNQVRGTPQGSATGYPEIDEAIGIKADAPVDSKIAMELAKRAPRYAVYRTNTKDMKPDDLAQARKLDREGDLSDGIIAGTADRNRVGGAQAAVKGDALFSSDSTGSVLDKYTGSLDTSNPMAGSTIRLRTEQAGQAKAGAAENYAQADNARASATKTREETGRARGGDIKEVIRPDGAVWLVNKTTGQARPVVDSDGNAVTTTPKGGGKGGAGGGKPLTEGQAKANLFGNRMQESDKVLREMEDEGVYRPGNIKAMAEGVAGAVPIIGDSLREGASAATNWTQSPAQQKIDQARRDFINAVLRRESGATIQPHEFENADKQYFPQLGDSKEVREQKRRNRERVTQLMLQEVPENHRQAAGQQPRGGAEGSWDAPKRPAGRNVKVDF